jgi:azurin
MSHHFIFSAAFLVAVVSCAAEPAAGSQWKPHDLTRPRPRVMTPPGFTTQERAGAPPSDATVLFDGTSLAKWRRDVKTNEPAGADDAPKWKVENGYMEIVPKSGTIRTREKIAGDAQWHLEWATPSVVVGSGQGRGNSGIFIGGFPEVQVLDSYENDTYPDGQAAGLYGKHPPLVNASRKPGEWQTYDIIAERERRDASGKVVKRARLTVIHNGVVVQWAREFDAVTPEADLVLQDHNNPVRYRNIWVRPLNLTDSDGEGTPPPPKPRVVRIKTPAAQMRYDVAEFSVEAGEPVKVILENIDHMPHNWVLFPAGTDVVAAANKNMEKPDEALKRDWLPDDPRILAHSKMVQPQATDEILFTAPAKSGVYPYVCTFPGHAMSMQGKMRVFVRGPVLKDLRYSLYLGAWEKLPDFAKLQPHREGAIPDGLVDLKFDDYKNHYGVIFTGELTVARDGDFRFFLASDDGARLRIDGETLIDSDGIHPAGTIREERIALKAGAHRFTLEYFQAEGQGELFVGWRGGGFGETPLSKWVPAKFRDGGPKKAEPPPMPLVVGSEPVVYRNFIAGAGSRGIAVGYPGGFNLAWSAQHMNLAVVWRGAFLDAGRHWTSRGGGAEGPLGFDAFQPTGDLAPALAVLTSPTDEWPKADPKLPAEGFVWKGYDLDAKRHPIFLYEWRGLKIAERYESQGDSATGGKLVRTLKLDGAIPSGTYLRLAKAGSLQPADGGWLVNAGRINLAGREYDNVFRIAADGAQGAGQNLLLPARPEMTITYTWPGTHAHGAH